MKIYPAIDILDGKCVRLFQGKYDAVTEYFEDPVMPALSFKNAGAQWLHVIDLNGAAEGVPKNIDTVRRVVKESGLKVEYGGGVRNLKTAERLFETGVERIIIGTSVITDPAFVVKLCQRYPGRIVASLDAKDGQVAVSGWMDGTAVTVLEAIRELHLRGIRLFIYTNISSDGTLRGVNIADIKNLLKEADIPVIVSGGVSSIEDINNLAEIEHLGIEGIIIGRALYENKLDLSEAIKAADGGTSG